MKIASVVLCFNRPEYLTQTLASLESNTEANRVDWFLFQDGITNEFSGISYSEEQPHKQVTELLEQSNLPNKTVVVQEHNLSPAQQRYNALSLLDEYDMVYCFDDDMVVSRHYLRLLRIMARKFPNHLGILYTEKSKPKKLQLVMEAKTPRLWGHYITRQAYSFFRERYTEYYNYIKTGDYHLRRKWTVRTKRIPYIMDDIAVTRLARDAGINKLIPLASRGLYIGKKGMVAYKLPEYWKRKGMDNQAKQIEFEQDAKLKEFMKK